MSETPAALSTSALAKALSKTTKQMFAELEALGWISRRDDSWNLTAKGEFEGGSYRESPKFGRYIIWPGRVIEHKALISPDSHMISSSQLGKQLALSRKTTDQLLLELGWVEAAKRGWVLSCLGEGAGGHQRENPTTGVPYILWSGRVLEDPCLNLRSQELHKGVKGDPLCCCDGHKVSTEAERKLDNWLYLNGLMHAYRRQLPFAESLYVDFYLPRQQLYMQYVGKQAAKDLPAKMRAREVLKQHQCRLIELNDEQLQNLDEVLPRQLLQFNIEV